jgi:hypothetical protein
VYNNHIEIKLIKGETNEQLLPSSYAYEHQNWWGDCFVLKICSIKEKTQYKPPDENGGFLF